MAQEQMRRTRETAEQGPVVLGGKAASISSEKLDDLVDQIDRVLEQNAEEFVKNYVQRGGE